MPASPNVLTKIRFLLNLGTSPNANESAAALDAAQKLIDKYGVTEAELESTKDEPEYQINTIIFKANSIIGWKQQLALACAKQFYCHVIIETLVSPFGGEEHTYYALGEDTDVSYVQFAFNALAKMVEGLVLANCYGRGPRYIHRLYRRSS